MAYDPDLVDRVRECLADVGAVTELKMFGGWGATVTGNMAVGVMGEDLIVRVGPEAYGAALGRTGARPFDFTGRAMTGWVYVDGDAVRTARALGRWVKQGVTFAGTLPPKTHARKRLRAGLLLAALLAVAGADVGVAGAQTAAPGADLRQSWSHGTCEGRGRREISALPMRADDIELVLPYGLMVGNHVTPIDHQYASPRGGRSSARDAYPVFAPFDGTVVLIQHRVSVVGGGAVSSDEWRIVFEASCDQWVYYDLVTSLAPSLRQAFDAAKGGTLSAGVRVRVGSGEEIGRIGGQTLDFGVVDRRRTLKGLARPESYGYEPWKVHTVDPLPYMRADVATAWEAEYLRTAAPRSGRLDHDIPGTVAGSWFREGTNGYAGTEQRNYWVGHLALAPNFLDPSKTIVSIGSLWGPGRQNQFTLRPGQPEPRMIRTSSGIVELELVDFLQVDDRGTSWNGQARPVGAIRVAPGSNVRATILVQLLGRERLKIEIFENMVAAQVDGFTPGAAIYTR